MPQTVNNTQNNGILLPTTNIWNVGTINQLTPDSPDFKRLLVDLYQNINNIVLALNLKDSAFYTTSAFLTGAQWYNPTIDQSNLNRTEYRKVINFGALGVATKSVAHGIVCNAQTQFVDIWAVANDPIGLTYLPIPFSSSVDVAHNIQLSVDNTNVTISNGIDRSNYTVCAVVLEYLQG